MKMNKNISKSYVIETKRFKLRIPSLEDIPYVFSATRFEGFNDGMMWEAPENEKELSEPLRKNIKSWELGTSYSFTIENKHSTALLGRIVIIQTKEKNVWSLGFWTHPESQGQGIMTEAINGVLKFGFETLLAIRIEAFHAIWNKASEKVLKKNGMKFVRYVEKGFKKNGKWVDENLLAISKEEWGLLRLQAEKIIPIFQT